MKVWTSTATALAFIMCLASCAKSERGGSEPSQANGHLHATPNPTEHTYCQVGDLRMYYEVYGQGRPLVLLHGGGSTIGESWARQIPYFAPTYRIIAPEQQGHGRTLDVDRPLSYVDMAEKTAQLLTQLKIRDADVLGWSDGGIVGLLLAARHPQLVRRLVVSGANISPSGLANQALAEWTPPADDSADRARYRQLHADPVDHYPVFQAKLTELWANHPTAEEFNVGDLAKIEAPTLVVAGDRDLIRLEHTALIYQSIPHAELLILPGSDHNTFGHRAARLNPIIKEFLDKPIELHSSINNQTSNISPAVPSPPNHGSPWSPPVP